MEEKSKGTNEQRKTENKEGNKSNEKSKKKRKICRAVVDLRLFQQTAQSTTPEATIISSPTKKATWFSRHAPVGASQS